MQTRPHPNAPAHCDCESAQLRVDEHVSAIAAQQWNALLAQQATPTPFMQHAYLRALQDSGCVARKTGWLAQYVSLWRKDKLLAACPLYFKNNSFGEYVFDWSWANAYAEHGLAYYPKAIVAVPFTPVPGSRLLAVCPQARQMLLRALLQICQDEQLSSLHVLFGDDGDQACCLHMGLSGRQQLQFHWHNRHPLENRPFHDFDDFLTALNQRKRKKIRQERRKVSDAGIDIRWARGPDIHAEDWDFFYRCYEKTYWEHDNPPYLNQDFFRQLARDMSAHCLLFVAEKDRRAVACSLLMLDDRQQTVYGRYWGALEHVDCLHFELCYYQAIAWCISHGIRDFQGGAQGVHKLQRALLPASTHSAHWLAHPAFARAVGHHLQQENEFMQEQLQELQTHSPYRQTR